MSRDRLIKRLKWYYPTERFHAYVTFPVILLFLLFIHPIRDMVLMTYGFVVCIIILYQGQWYWKLKLDRLQGEQIDQEKNLDFFRKWKYRNGLLIFFMIPVFLFQAYLWTWDFFTKDIVLWAIVVNVFAVLEHINYYHIQLMIDNKYDMRFVVKNKRLKTASLAKDLKENKI